MAPISPFFPLVTFWLLTDMTTCVPETLCSDGEATPSVNIAHWVSINLFPNPPTSHIKGVFQGAVLLS